MVVNIGPSRAAWPGSLGFFGAAVSRRTTSSIDSSAAPTTRNRRSAAVAKVGQGQGQGRAPRQREQTTVAAGTGFIISKDGLILTNNHVVEDATKIEVSLFGEDNDQTYAAKLVGKDALTDSALIQLVEKPNHPLPEAKFGDSSQMAPGDWVMAIGNPFNQGWTVTVGVISATQRSFTTDGRTNEMLQTMRPSTPATRADRC